MANLPSAKKRVKQYERNRVRNRARKSVIKTETRRMLDAIQRGDLQEAQDTFVRVTKKIDQVAAKSTLHRNTAARKKSRLARRLNAALANKSE
ncbi:MAG: 30S ribosomal protein S20 [Phycisphaerales bacterium]|nr:MAG: 30S ribosomal protein S20 [Phycisphaerales bacterium]